MTSWSHFCFWSTERVSGRVARSFRVGIITEQWIPGATAYAGARVSRNCFVLGAWITFAESRERSFARSSAVSTSNQGGRIWTVSPAAFNFAIVPSHVVLVLHGIPDKRSTGHLRKPRR